MLNILSAPRCLAHGPILSSEIPHEKDMFVWGTVSLLEPCWNAGLLSRRVNTLYQQTRKFNTLAWIKPVDRKGIGGNGIWHRRLGGAWLRWQFCLFRWTSVSSSESSGQWEKTALWRRSADGEVRRSERQTAPIRDFTNVLCYAQSHYVYPIHSGHNHNDNQGASFEWSFSFLFAWNKFQKTPFLYPSL